MSALPAPLVSAEVSLTANDWFPLHHQRLPKSKWWRRASDMARARNVMLWCAAYGQTPAGSLPDDDDELAEAAGFGMNMEAFAVAKAEIMAPWTLCSDGRWYHPTLAEVVLETWEKQSTKRKADAERKKRSRDRVRGAPEEVTRDIEPPPQEDTCPVTRDIDIQTDRTDRTGQIVKDPPSESPLSTKTVDIGQDDMLAGMFFGDAREPALPAVIVVPLPDLCRQAFEAYNVMAREHGLPVARDLSNARRAKMRARFGKDPKLWQEVLDAVPRSPHLLGQNDRGWRADLDFLLREDKFGQVIEGRYLKAKEIDHGHLPASAKSQRQRDNIRRGVAAASNADREYLEGRGFRRE